MRRKAAVWRASTAAVSLSLLRELGDYLVDIHGQCEHLSLLNVRQHWACWTATPAAGPSWQAYARHTYRKLQALRRELNDCARPSGCRPPDRC